MLSSEAFSFVKADLAISGGMHQNLQGLEAIEAAITQRETSTPGYRGAVRCVIDGQPRRFTLLPRVPIDQHLTILPLITWRFVPEDTPGCGHYIILARIVDGTLQLPDGYFSISEKRHYDELVRDSVLHHAILHLLKIREETLASLLAGATS